MDPAIRRLVEQLTKRLDALTTAFRESQRPKPTSWVQNTAGGAGSKYSARMMGAWSAKSVSAQIYTLDGVDVLYKETATLYDPLSVFAALGTNDWLYCTLQDGKYYAADPASCPGTSPLISAAPATQPEE